VLRKPKEPTGFIDTFRDGDDRFGRRCDFGSRFVVRLEDDKGRPIHDPVPIHMALKRDGQNFQLIQTQDLEIEIDCNPYLVIAKICDGDTVLTEEQFIGPIDRICYPSQV